MADACRDFLTKSDQTEVIVFRLNSAFEMDLLLQVDNIDILVVPVSCFHILEEKMPKIFKSQRLQYVWFDQIHEISQESELKMKRIVGVLTQKLDVQVIKRFSMELCFLKTNIFR